VRLAQIPQANEERQGAAVNGKLYLFGGNPVAEGNAPGAPPGAVWEYDAAADRWAQKKNMPLPAHHVAVVEQGGKIYVFGGAAQPKAGGPNYVPVNNAWEYDPASDGWKALAPMPSKRIAAVAVSVGGKIYVMGGAGNYRSREDQALNANEPHRILDTNEAYDPATNTWQTRQTMPTPRSHVAASAANGRIYLIGGRLASMAVANGSTTDIVEEYDPATDRWGFLKLRMPTPRDSAIAVTYQGRIYVVGGQTINAISNSVSRALEAYDPGTNTWVPLPNLPVARHGMTGALIGSRFHVVGGHITAAFSGGEPLNVAAHDAFEFAPR
jgi:N-acetylneuraminic acid mutarotase